MILTGIIIILAPAILAIGMIEGMKAGRRLYQIELRQALHRGEDIVEMIEGGER